MNEIQDATKLLEAYRQCLNRATKRCPHCGMVYKVNWKEYQRAEQLEGILRKLSRWLVEDQSKSELQS
jgi:hypothetical protein